MYYTTRILLFLIIFVPLEYGSFRFKPYAHINLFSMATLTAAVILFTLNFA